MTRDYGKEIDNIREQLDEIKDLLVGNKKNLPATPTNTRVTADEDEDRVQNETLEILRKRVQDDGVSAAMTCSGILSSDKGTMSWVTIFSGLDRFTELIETNAADKVIACIGNEDRVGILLSLLNAPKTAAQLVDACGYRSTGRIYHLLKPLLAADLVKEDGDQRGVYVINGKRIPGVMMMLEGIRQLGEDYHENPAE